MNLVVLQGNLGRDPSTFTTGSGGSYTSLATGQSWKDRDGVWQERTTWHNLIASGHLGERLAKLHKGDGVLIRGQITSKRKEVVLQDGKGLVYYESSISLDSLKVLSRKDASTDPRQQAQESAQGAGIKTLADDVEDRIPF